MSNKPEDSEERFILVVELDTNLYKAYTPQMIGGKLETLRGDAPLTIDKGGASMWWWIEKFIHDFDEKKTYLTGRIHVTGFARVKTKLCAHEYAYKILDDFRDLYLSKMFPGIKGMTIVPSLE